MERDIRIDDRGYHAWHLSFPPRYLGHLKGTKGRCGPAVRGVAGARASAAG